LSGSTQDEVGPIKVVESNMYVQHATTKIGSIELLQQIYATDDPHVYVDTIIECIVELYTGLSETQAGKVEIEETINCIIPMLLFRILTWGAETTNV
jgi:hypothetical protein